MHDVTPRAVCFSEFGGVDVLRVEEIDIPSPGPGEVVVDVVASGINHMEAFMREGRFQDSLPSHFPQREGSDFAGVVRSVGRGVTAIAQNMNVLGGVYRASHATHLVVPVDNVIPKPPHLSWEVAGGLYLAGVTGYTTVRSLNLSPGETIVITAAAGGVGTVESSLARLHGARVIGTCSAGNADYLRTVGVTPVLYGDNLAERLREAAEGDPIVGYIDNSGGENEAVARELGVKDERIRGIAHRRDIEISACQAEPNASRTHIVSHLARLLDEHAINIPISGYYPLDHAGQAFVDLDRLRARGKVVLGTRPVHYKYQRVQPAGIIARDIGNGDDGPR